MSTRSVVSEWLFRSLSLEDALERLEADGLAIRASSDPGAVQRALSLQDFSVDVRRSAMKAFPAYLALFCFENALRELISQRLSENVGPDWWTVTASQKVQDKVRKRQDAEGAERWNMRRGDHPIYYSDFGDLKAIITSSWQVFQDLFPDLNWIVARLDELESLRNIIAHSNVLENREVERLKLYLEDWTRQVG